MQDQFRPLLYAFRLGSLRLPLLWLSGLLLVTLQLVAPYQVGLLTNSFSASSKQTPLDNVATAILLIIVAQVGMSAIQFWQRLQVTSLKDRIRCSLVMDLARKLMRVPPEFFRKREITSLSTRVLEDSNSLVKASEAVLVEIPVSLLMIGALGTYMVYQNWFLGLLMLPLALLTGYFMIFDRLLQELKRNSRHRWDEVRNRVHEIICGVSELRNHNAYEQAISSLRREFDAYQVTMKRGARWNAFFVATDGIVQTAQMSILYWAGALMCIGGTWFAKLGGQLTWGAVIQFMLVVGLFQTPVFKISSSFLRWRLSRENILRVREVMDHPSEWDSGGAPDSSACEPIAEVAFEDVSVTAADNNRILGSITTRLPLGNRVGVVGPAGCGKSTFMKLIAREGLATSGSVYLNQQSITEYDRSVLAQQIGYVQQRAILLNSTIRENILLSLRRPSNRFITDKHGRVDISTLANVESLEELDRELIRIVHQVAFGNDVFRKGLDSKGKFISEEFGPMRSLVAKKLESSGQKELVVPFESDQIFIEGTLGENLLGPNQDWNAFAPSERTIVCSILSKSKILEPLLRLGYQRLCHDRALAVRLGERSPKLRELLIAGDILEIEVPEVDGSQLVDLPLEIQSALLKIAVVIDCRKVGDSTSGGQLMEKMVLARRQLIADGRLSQGLWPTKDEYLTELSIRENLLFGRPNRQIYRAQEQIDQLLRDTLKDAGLESGLILKGLDFEVGEGGKNLSGGQRQKVSLARVLMKRPSVLLLDEATASMDALSQDKVASFLSKECTGKIQVSISHRFSTLNGFDAITVFDRGQLVQSGTFSELVRAPGLFRDLAKLQQDVPPLDHPDLPEPASDLSAPDRQPLLIHPSRQALRQCELFTNLDSVQLEFLENVTHVVNCSAGTVLFRRGDAGDDFFLILNGEVEFLAPDHRTEEEFQVVDTFGPGRAFGELALLGSFSRTLGARARTDLELCVLSREDFLKLLEADSTVAIALLTTLANRISEIRDEVYSDPTKHQPLT